MSESQADQVKSLIKRQRGVLAAINDSFDMKLPQWRDRTIRFLKGFIVQEELDILLEINGSTWELEKEAYLGFLDDVLSGIGEMPEQFLIQEEPLTSGVEVPQKIVGKGIVSNKVFVVHGHDGLSKTEVARTLEKIKLEAIILHEQPNEGKTIIEKFEGNAAQVGFAVILLTPDDIGYPKNKPDTQQARARQNVILELGYFSGILGRSKVCVLYKGAVEIPSDYLGVVYVPMDEAGAWKFNLAKELKQAGLPVDLNDLV